MSRITKCVLLVILFKLNILNVLSNCDEYESSSGLSIKWPATESGKCVLSEPPCIDKNMELRRRCCVETGWTKEPECKDIQHIFYDEYCPPNTEYITKDVEEGEDLFEYCYTKSINCPYDDVVYDMRNELWTNSLYPASRDVTNGIDLFRHSGYSSKYKLPLEEIGTDILDLNKNCVFLAEEGVFEAISCDDVRQRTCIYDIIYNYASDGTTYCNQKMNYDLEYFRYFTSGYNVSSKCFGIEQIVTLLEWESKNSPGTAEVLYANQKWFVFVHEQEELSFGLRKINETYYWIASNTKVNSTDWSLDEQFNDEEAIYGVLTTGGWTLSSLLNLPKLNQYDVIVSEPSLNLMLEENVLYLKITNYKDLKFFKNYIDLIYGIPEKVYCFTDADLSNIIVRYDSEEMEDISDDYFSLRPLQNAPGKYWCEAIKYATLKIIKSNTVYYTKEEWFGNVYLGAFIYTYTEADNVLTQEFVTKFRNMFYDNLDELTVVKFQKIDSINTSNNKVKVVLEFLEIGRDKVVDYVVLQQNYDGMLQRLETIIQNKNMEVVEFANFDYCIGEVQNEGNDIKLNWPNFLGKIDEIMHPNEVAITKYGKLLNVKCVQDYYLGAKWEPITQDFYIESQTSITPKLIDLINETYTAEEIIHKLHVIIDTNIDEIGPIDVYVISEILDFILNLEEIPLSSTIEVTDKIASINRGVLYESQVKFNATDRILTSLDGIYVKLSYANNGVTEKSNSVLFATFDLSQNNISAVAVEIIDNQYALKVYNDRSDLDFENSDYFVGAMLLDENLRKQIVKFFQNKKPPQLIVVVYIRDSFFNPEHPVKATVNVIFDVLLPDFSEEFVTPIPIVYKVSDTFFNKKACSFWSFYNYHPDFSTNKGDWFKEGYAKSNLDSHLVTCNFWHVTHFTLLILENPKAISATHQNILDKITLVNCVFSGTGLVAILVTAVIFKKWRSNKGNHILINFSVAIALQITLLYVSDFTQGQNRPDVSCIIVGAALHYSVIAEFSWMLLIAYLQYKRLVDVFTVRTKHIVFKSYLIGWLIPIIPVGYLLIIDSNSYLDSDTGLCYPSGIQLYITVWFPVAVVVAINATIYCFIFHSLLRKNPEIDNQQEDLIFQIRLAILLFIMLGITWIFGFLSLVQSGLIFVYVFVFLSTLQGFVLFLFFILLNKKTREMYSHFIHKKTF